MTAQECYAMARKCHAIGATILAWYWEEKGRAMDLGIEVSK